jgi:hypothetical protein
VLCRAGEFPGFRDPAGELVSLMPYVCETRVSALKTPSGEELAALHALDRLALPVQRESLDGGSGLAIRPGPPRWPGSPGSGGLAPVNALQASLVHKPLDLLPVHLQALAEAQLRVDRGDS